MNLHWIRVLLMQWGARNRAQGIGYPTMAATEKARVGRGGLFREPELPQDLAEVDAAVNQLEPQHRMIIAECYTHRGTHADHAIRLRLSEASYYRRKKVAEQRVNAALTRERDFLHSMTG